MLRDHLHGHQCPDCGHYWEHHPDNIGEGYEPFLKAHTCQKCGGSDDRCRDPLPPISRYEALLDGALL